MGNRLTDLSFDEWVEFTFARPREKDSSQRDYWDGPPAVTLAYLTRAFDNAGAVFASISDEQLAEAFWNLGNDMIVMHDSPSGKYMKPGGPGKDRARALRSILTLFQDVFAVRCVDHLCHLDYSEAGQERKDPIPLNGICYMWWDIHHAAASEDDPCRDEIDTAILDVLEGTLALDSVACQESALHGLSDAIGWQISLLHEDLDDVTNWDEEPWVRRSEAMRRARAIIDAYLIRNPSLAQELKEYAHASWFSGVQ